jgi:hypothetical protein
MQRDGVRALPSRKEKPVIKLLLAFYHKVYWLTSGASGNPGLTMFSRLMLILLVLGFGGQILWHALVTIPAGVVAALCLSGGIRIALWYWRRH